MEILFYSFFFFFLHHMGSCFYTCPGTNSMTYFIMLSNGPNRLMSIDMEHNHIYSLMSLCLVFITIDKLLKHDSAARPTILLADTQYVFFYMLFSRLETFFFL